MMGEAGVSTSTRYVYSDKIRERRRSLFPNPSDAEKLDKDSDSSDLGKISPLDSSDNENENINLVASTNLVTEILNTPKSKNYEPSEHSMSPLYLSPYGNYTHSAPSPTECLKTPNDSSVDYKKAPRIPRKNLNDYMIFSANMKRSSVSPSSPKHSKARTSLFPENDISVTPTRFYPKAETLNSSHSEKVSQQIQKLKSTAAEKKKTSYKTKSKRKLFGQINGGVRHNIRKPKPSGANAKLSKAALKSIKTYKKESVVEQEFSDYFNDLSELKKNKETKLIQHSHHNSETDHQVTATKRPLPQKEETSNVAKKQKLTVDPDDFDDSNEEQTQDLNNVLNLLENSLKTDIEKGFKRSSDTFLSPTSEMCNMASVMKIQSPTKMKNLNEVFEKMTDKPKDTSKGNNAKLYPVFYDAPKSLESHKQTLKSEVGNKRKRLKVAADQMLLDAGQKRFGLIQCPNCSFTYNAGDPTDEALHDKFHTGSKILHFYGWKNERVLEKLPNEGRIIEIPPNAPKTWIEKAKQVIDFINRDLGVYDLTFNADLFKIYFYIFNRSIIGCLVAEKKETGYKMLSSVSSGYTCSTEEYPILCGIARLWVHPNYRKKGVATRLVNTLKKHFSPSHPLENHDIAIGSPTGDGKLFATKYFKTANFLTYLF